MLRLNNVLRIEFHVFRNICDHEKIFHVTDTRPPPPPRSAEDCAKLRGDDKQRITFHNTSTYFLQSPYEKFVYLLRSFPKIILKHGSCNMFNIVKTGPLFTIHVFSRIKKIVFFSEVLLKLIKIFDSDYVTYNIVRTGRCFPGYSDSQESAE